MIQVQINSRSTKLGVLTVEEFREAAFVPKHMSLPEAVAQFNIRKERIKEPERAEIVVNI